MPFQPERVGPAALAAVHKLLTDAGLQVAHLEITYDGQESEETYTHGAHFFPVGHGPGHQFNLAKALRTVAPLQDEPTVNGMIVRFFPDGTVVVAPAALTTPGAEEDDDDDAN